MTMGSGFESRRTAAGTAVLCAGLLGVFVAGLPQPVRAAGLSAAEAAGSWDLAFERGNRRCRLTLRGTREAGVNALTLPAGCHRAFPVLASVTGWITGAASHLVLVSGAGQPVVDFGPGGGATLSAVVGEAADIYVLTPVSPEAQRVLAEAAAAPPDPLPPSEGVAAAEDGVLVGGAASATPVATAPAPMLPPATAAEVAGHYAVMRQTRDTGCMVTLEAVAAAGGEQRARLAPACRDQGIVIFDPVGWALSKGQLVLSARKGHKALLTHRTDRTWSTTPAKGAALVLKRL